MTRKELLKNLYIIALDTPEVDNLQIQFTPFDINYTRQANIADIQIVGRNDNLHHYISGQTEVSMTLDFYSIEPGGADAKEKAKWLESMMYSEGDRAPSRLKIVFGSLFKDEIWILRSCSVTYSVFQPSNDFLPRYAICDITLVRDTVLDLTSSKIRDQIF